jgi:hypothetical protein
MRGKKNFMNSWRLLKLATYRGAPEVLLAGHHFSRQTINFGQRLFIFLNEERFDIT